MDNSRISQKQGIFLIVMFIIGESMLMVMGLEAKMDIWIAILLAGGAGALIMLVYARLMSVLPNKDFFQTLEFFIGKIGSKIVIFLFALYAFDTCSLVLRNYGQFIVTVGLPETPLIVAMFILIVLCAVAVKAGIEVLGRWSVPFLLFIITFLLLSVILVSQNMDISNLFPVFDSGIVPIAKGVLGIITFPFAETVIFLFVFPPFKKGISVKKVFLKGLAIGGGLILITSLTDVLVLGTDICKNMYYPTYSTMATVHYGNFLQRFEVITSIVFIIGVFVKISIYLFAACKGIASLFGFKDYGFFALPLAFLVLNNAFIFDDMIYFHEWVLEVWPYYTPIFQIIIPLILLIIIEIKIKKNKKVLPKHI